jgi:molybdopterin-dependent oxidoreductase alpha subunit
MVIYVKYARAGMKRWSPSLWASRKPFGIGEQRPNNYGEFWRALRDNRGNLRYAWRILNRGVCDGCALGTTGMRDWTLPEIHLCNVRLRLLSLNTMPALDVEQLADIGPLRDRPSAELRALGRLPYPMLRRRGEPGFRRISWDEALDLAADRIRSSSPDRLGVYLTSRGQVNENYYAVQKAVRALGTNSIDNAARVCHSPSTFALKGALGVAASTCSYRDWIGSDLIVFVGSNVAANQPVAMKYLYHARKEGTKVAVVNTYREPGMERYWVPSNLESALFGTRIADRFFLVSVGGDVAFLNGTLKALIEQGGVDRDFVEQHTSGFDLVEDACAALDWGELERGSGSTREEMAGFAAMLAEARTAVLVWSMGVTQHEKGEDAVRAVVNLGLARGFIGRAHCGLMPIRGHSGVQGGAEMGCYSTAFPGNVPIDETSAERFSELWDFAVPASRGLTAPEMIDAAQAGELDVLASSGGNFLEVLPDPAHVREALERVPLRVHADIVLSSQMLVDGKEVLLLPATTRYEIPGGVTETSTERRIIFSPEISGPRIGEARPEWEIFTELARRVRPHLAGRLAFSGTAAIRDEIARAVPFYDGIQRLHKQGDHVQYGGERLCEGWRFPTDDGKAHFALVPVPRREVPEGSFVLSTRRGKQFNSMVQERRDSITGAGRDSVLVNGDDADGLGLRDGDDVLVVNERGSLPARVLVAPVARGCVQVHWPEGQVLIDRNRRSAESGVPDYNAHVRLERRSAR